MATKVCTKCGLEKDVNEFGWERRFKRASQCKTCRVEKRMEYYEENKEKELAYKWDRQIRQREKARVYVTEYLRNHPCVDCGETDTMILTFDHVRGTKKMAVSQMVNQDTAPKLYRPKLINVKYVATIAIIGLRRSEGEPNTVRADSQLVA